jgi:hypothetical protein
MPLATVLETHDAWRLQRRAFLASVEDYNQQIARYALAVASPALSSDRVVGMLIETPSRDRSVLVRQDADTGIRRVSNEEPIPSRDPAGWTQRP